MACEVFPIDHLAEPFLHHRRIDIIVIHPFLIAGIVRRIDINALDFSGIDRKQSFQRNQVVAVDDEVVMQTDFFRQALLFSGNQLMVFDCQSDDSEQTTFP